MVLTNLENKMEVEEKLIKMFHAVHGEVSGSCYIEVSFNDEQEPDGINLMKHGNFCWHASKSDLLFDYLTIDMEN